VPAENLIHVKDRFLRLLLDGETPDTGRAGRATMEASDKSQWPLSEPLFIVLVCAGYVAVALAYYFMFNHANLQL
jgi:hypothetical protein